MDEHADGVMIALLPINSDWCKLELPHMTLVYAGTVDQHGDTSFNEMAKDAGAIAMTAGVLSLRTLGVEQFGADDEEKVDVLRLLNTPELMAMRRSVEKWNKSEFPFRPHATIGPTGFIEPGNMPGRIAFDRIAVVFGEQMITFWLKRS